MPLPPQDRVKLFAPPLLNIGNFWSPPFNMAKTSSYYIKTTPKLFVPPFSMARTFSVGVKLHMPLLPFCSPPLPVISDQSLSCFYTFLILHLSSIFDTSMTPSNFRINTCFINHLKTDFLMNAVCQQVLELPLLFSRER